MELKEFVKETLVQIMEGVNEAQEVSDKYGAIVNPRKIENIQLSARINDEVHSVQNVEFEVGLTESKSDENKTGIGVLLSIVGIGTENKGSSALFSVSRIKFSIPIILPSICNNNSKSPYKSSSPIGGMATF